MKKVNAVDIIRRLVTRFKLQESSAQTFELNELIQPTTDSDKLLQQVRYLEYPTVAVGAAGDIEAFVVPTGKRWTIFTLLIEKDTGTYTYSLLGVRDVSSTTPTNTVDLIRTAAAATLTFNAAIVAPLVLESGDSIRFGVDGFTGAGQSQVHIGFIEEDLY
ncbi:MAG: hypothetical protein NTU93_00020 [Arthrobacter sp.]|nr:hypothetical protein [Arthrobacter sp.]